MLLVKKKWEKKQGNCVFKEMSGKDVPNARFSCPVIFTEKASDEGIFDNAASGILLPPLEFRILTNWCPLKLEYVHVCNFSWFQDRNIYLSLPGYTYKLVLHFHGFKTQS